MKFQPVSELFVTDNAWYKMWWIVFIFHKEQVTCGGAISEVINWLCLQHSPSKQFVAFGDKQGPSLRIRLAEDLGNKAWETGQLLKLSYLLSKVPGKASFK